MAYLNAETRQIKNGGKDVTFFLALAHQFGGIDSVGPHGNKTFHHHISGHRHTNTIKWIKAERESRTPRAVCIEML